MSFFKLDTDCIKCLIKGEKKEECNICLEEKYLFNFCEKHKFCNECNKDWINNSFKCPACRNICTNLKYAKYNFRLVNFDNDKIDLNYVKIYFNNWHNFSCLKKKHKFTISRINKEVELVCTNCNVSQYFKFLKY